MEDLKNSFLNSEENEDEDDSLVDDEDNSDESGIDYNEKNTNTKKNPYLTKATKVIEKNIERVASKEMTKYFSKCCNLL